ncbi:MAG TPA: hypothetical protein VHW23_28750, partial [Kofleriaceae bacterium]|nr:hypothetical protein [Kofleriaceae bacterium]
PAHGVPRTLTPAHGVPAPRATPAGGFPPSAREPGPPAARAASAPRPSTPTPAPRPAQSWTAATPHTLDDSPWDPANEADTVRGGPAPKGFAPAKTPPGGSRLRRSSGQATVTSAAGGSFAADLRTPTDPEIETYLELEADLPPGPDAERDLESEAALRSLTDELEEHESVSILIEEEGRRVIETITETSSHTLTVTVTEAATEYQRAITAEDGTEVSGSISIPEDPSPPKRRARRQSDGWED